jgi:hypothetical protein
MSVAARKTIAHTKRGNQSGTAGLQPSRSKFLQWHTSKTSPYSRAAAAALHRLPEHEVCGCW